MTNRAVIADASRMSHVCQSAETAGIGFLICAENSHALCPDTRFVWHSARGNSLTQSRGDDAATNTDDERCETYTGCAECQGARLARATCTTAAAESSVSDAAHPRNAPDSTHQ